MWLRRLNRLPKKTKLRIRIAYSVVLFLLVLGTVALVFALKTKEQAFLLSGQPYGQVSALADVVEVEPFPVGVDPRNKSIKENPEVDAFVKVHLANMDNGPRQRNWFGKLLAKLTEYDWYQNLASPSGRILVVEPGERREQVADNFGAILHWDERQQSDFLSLVASSTPAVSEGKFFPAHYLVGKDSTPEEVALKLNQQFQTEIIDRYPEEVSKYVSLKDALIVASLLEREAYDFEDMRYIAGVIWNRLFIKMNLQIDASLQYAKGSRSDEPWWPPVIPDDKYIDSPFNTYKNNGLPPEPIASPSVESIVAALNPKNTDCLFYFHDARGDFYCSVDYEEHVAKLKKIYGQGR